MSNQKISTITLTGTDSINFVNSLFRPSKEEIARNREILDGINNTVTINKLENGFEAEISDLDLSFLDETNILNQNISFEVPFKINRYSDYMNFDCQSISSILTVAIKKRSFRKSTFNSTVDTKYLSVAA